MDNTAVRAKAQDSQSCKNRWKKGGYYDNINIGQMNYESGFEVESDK